MNKFALAAGRAMRHSTAVVIAIGVVAVLAAGSAHAQPPVAITTCTKITKPGLYEVDNDLYSGSGDCLIVTAGQVSLNLNRAHLYGGNTGAGVHVMRSAVKALIEGNRGVITSFGVGVQIDANGTLADNFTVLSSADAGVLLNRVQQADVSTFYALNNRNDGVRISGGGANTIQSAVISGSGRYGIWVQGSSRNNIGNFTVQNNQFAGIYLGCSTVGPQGLCPQRLPASNWNYLFSGTANIANSGWQQYGVAIDRGNNFNRVINVGAWQNADLDLFDGNSDCASDYWFAEPTIGLVLPEACIN